MLIKPSPDSIQETYLASLEALGIKAADHDIRFVEDNWESPTLGAWGVGWEVWLDGMEVTQFTYFQQCGGLDCKPVSIEITYGLERLAMYLQDVESIWDLSWNADRKYGDIWLPFEKGQCQYNFEASNPERLKQLFSIYEAEASDLIEKQLPAPALDFVLKCSHTFNLLALPRFNRGCSSTLPKPSTAGLAVETDWRVGGTAVQRSSPCVRACKASPTARQLESTSGAPVAGVAPVLDSYCRCTPVDRGKVSAGGGFATRWLARGPGPRQRPGPTSC